MSILILGGLAKSLKLSVPDEDITRPTSVMLRRKIFDARQDLTGFRFIDLCAGSGAVGFEAWSRGADEVLLLEQNAKAFLILKKNSELIKHKFNNEVIERPIQTIKADFHSWLKDYSPKQNDILFFDPPYEKHDLYLNFFLKLKAMPDRPEVWIESDSQKGLSTKALDEQNLPIFKNYVQGTSFVVIMKKSRGELNE